MTLWRDTVTKSPSKARVHNNFGHALRNGGDLREALQQFEQALALDPDYPDALNNLATLYANIGRKDDTISLLKRTLSQRPGHVPAHYNLAMNYYDMGLLDEARAEYQLILELAPYSREAAFARSMIIMIDEQSSSRQKKPAAR
jgi:tetratricopeptide (TPR) repeat protein